MSIDNAAVKEAKAALKEMSIKTKSKMTRQQFVASLIKEIHAKLEAGFQLGEVCAELNKTLPEDQQIKEATFRAYVRSARQEAGIKPIRTWTRRTDKASAKDSLKDDNLAHIKDKSKANTISKTASGFREMDDEL